MSHTCPFFRFTDGDPMICETDCMAVFETCRNRPPDAKPQDDTAKIPADRHEAYHFDWRGHA